MRRQVGCGFAAAVLVAGCGGSTDDLTGTFCDQGGRITFDGRGGAKMEFTEGTVVNGRYEYRPESRDVSINLGEATLEGSLTTADTLRVGGDVARRC